jgi:hypothetical protein
MDLHPDLKTFVELLRQIETLLRNDGDPWADRIGQCAEEVGRRDAYGAKRFLGYLGGMGSLNDVVLMRNGRPLQIENDRLHELIQRASELGRRLWNQAQESIERYTLTKSPLGAPNPLSLFKRTLKAAQKFKSSHPSLFVINSIISQLEYLVALQIGMEIDRSRLKDVILGVQAAREIDNLDLKFADLLYQVAEAVERMRATDT